ncbi:hypothetical protein L1887_19524 [Cichorium endivia]|nr:hypothetical protein L1887_19524 [Cichorium endivia]
MQNNAENKIKSNAINQLRIVENEPSIIVLKKPSLISPLIRHSPPFPNSCRITTMDRLLYETVLKGDQATFLKLVQENETLITHTVVGSLNTVLHLAARFGHLELVLEILKLCPDMIVAENRDLETPLHEACREGQVEVMKVLIAAHEGVVGKVNCRGESVLFVACERGKIQVVKHLLGFQWLLIHELDAFMCSIHVAAAGGHAGFNNFFFKNFCSMRRSSFASKREVVFVGR